MNFQDADQQATAGHRSLGCWTNDPQFTIVSESLRTLVRFAFEADARVYHHCRENFRAALEGLRACNEAYTRQIRDAGYDAEDSAVWRDTAQLIERLDTVDIAEGPETVEQRSTNTTPARPGVHGGSL